MTQTRVRAGSSTVKRRGKDDPVTDYARAVCDGRTVAGPHVRDACRRHLDDLEHGAQRGLRWDVEAAHWWLSFFPEVLRLNGGDFEDQPFKLLRWQVFIVGSLNGWRGADGYRRFRVAYVETGKGSGKSPLAAGIGMLGLVADGEARAEIYAAATKKDQAMVLFRDAVAMWQMSPELRQRLTPSGSAENIWNLGYRATASFFRPISNDEGQSGPRPHIGLIDEVHEHRTDTAVENMRAGTKSRRQALIFMITNSGSSPTSPCRRYHDYGAKIAAGQLHDDAYFAYICALDKPDDPFTNESCWPKVNPSLTEANLPGLKYLREQVVEARGMPAKEATVRRLNFCEWTEAEAPWLSADIWMRLGRDYDAHQLRGRRAWAGVDLSSTTDLTALVLVVEPAAADEPWSLLAYCWLPGDNLLQKAELDAVPYLQWKAEGHLETTPGRAISKRAVVNRIAQLCADFDVQSMSYDLWRMQDLIALAEEEGIALPELRPFGQGYKSMSPAIETFEAQLLNEKLVHNNHPVLTWCAANAVTVSDDANNRKLSKRKATGRIDLIVAAVMAVHAAIGAQPEVVVPAIINLDLTPA